MKVLVACEFSGTVRDAFTARGHEAVSCDLLETESPGPHLVGDALAAVRSRDWDLLIGHPPCTYLSNSGARWLYEPNAEYIGELARALADDDLPLPQRAVPDKDRLVNFIKACPFFMALWTCGIPKICLENPIQHREAKERLPSHCQVIHPWQHGHGESKATCLWLKGLPKLEPSKVVEGRKQVVHLLGPSDDRWKLRSKTYEGIARAMAEQWG